MPVAHMLQVHDHDLYAARCRKRQATTEDAQAVQLFSLDMSQGRQRWWWCTGRRLLVNLRVCSAPTTCRVVYHRKTAQSNFACVRRLSTSAVVAGAIHCEGALPVSQPGPNTCAR